MARGSKPASRSAATARLPVRLDKACPPASASSGRCANSGTAAPRAWKIWIWAAVFGTWSAPRTTWVTPNSASSKVEDRV